MDGEIATLEQDLGPFGFQWLAAVALQDAPVPALTEALGVALAAALRDAMPLTFDERANFYTLPWLRDGHIPSEAREILRARIDPVVRDIARQVFDAADTSKASR